MSAENTRNRAGTTGNHSGTTSGTTSRGAGREVVPSGGYPRRGYPGNRSLAPRRPEIAADLALASRGLPADWTIRRDGVRIGHVVCPDANTALILATFRFGAGVTVHPGGAA